jgi:secernin
MDLVRLGLERGRDAREALEVIAGLLETYGQGGSALAPNSSGYHNSFMIADPVDAWILETSGRRWAARRADLDALSNHITIGTDWDIGSRDLDTFARDEGWWPGRGRLDVAGAYRNRHVPGRISEGRLRRSKSLLASGRGSIDSASMRTALRDHEAGGIAPPRDATPDDERYFTLCMHSEPVGTTTASLVAALPTDRSVPWPVWVSFATPCTGIFVPVYLDGLIPLAFARGSEKENDPTESAWWAMHLLQEAASVDFARFTPALRGEWRALEEQIERERERVEAAARTAALAGERDESARLLSDFMAATSAWVIARANDLRAQISI